MTNAKRAFLTVPGQVASIRITGDAGIGYDLLAATLAKTLEATGLAVDVSHRGHREATLDIRCMTVAEERAAYLDSLEPEQLECLRGHLEALGYDLDKSADEPYRNRLTGERSQPIDA